MDMADFIQIKILKVQALREFSNHLLKQQQQNDQADYEACMVNLFMGPEGLELNMGFELSGHPSKCQFPIWIDRNGSKRAGCGQANTHSMDRTLGVSYSANLTSDDTGIGTWTEEQFMVALKEGKFKGLNNVMAFLPPMTWELFQHI